MTTDTATATALAPVVPVTFGRTLAVEFRKLVNTRAGAALALGGVAAIGAFGIGRLVFSAPGLTWSQLVSAAAIPASWLVMVQATLLVTGEFGSARPGLTFTLDPRRGRVLAAKSAAVTVTSLAAFLIAVLVAAVGNLALGSAGMAWSLDATRLAVTAGGLVFTALTGLAWGLATRNAPATIVVLLLWPTVAVILAGLSDAAAAVLAWIDMNPLFALLTPTDLVWAQVATSTVAWIVVPGAVGVRRLLAGDL